VHWLLTHFGHFLRFFLHDLQVLALNLQRGEWKIDYFCLDEFGVVDYGLVGRGDLLLEWRLRVAGHCVQLVS
jgi:hypothetical protein